MEDRIKNTIIRVFSIFVERQSGNGTGSRQVLAKLTESHR